LALGHDGFELGTLQQSLVLGESVIHHILDSQAFASFAPAGGQNLAAPDRGLAGPESVGALPFYIFGLIGSFHDFIEISVQPQKIDNALLFNKLRGNVCDWELGSIISLAARFCQGKS